MLYNMKNMLINMFLLIESVIGAKNCDTSDIFYQLAQMYMVKDNEYLKETFDNYCSVTEKCDNKLNSLTDYNYAMRMIDYSKITGQECIFSTNEQDILKKKGLALRVAYESKLLFEYAVSKDMLTERLHEAYNNGVILANCILGYMYLAGVGVEQNHALAIKILAQAEQWGSADATLMSLFADTENIDRHLTSAKTIYEYFAQGDLDIALSQHYGAMEEVESDYNLLIILKYFNQYPESRMLRNERIVKIVYAKNLDERSKSRLIMGEGKEAQYCISKLPLFDHKSYEYTLSYDEFIDTPLAREKEREEIWPKVCEYDMRYSQKYKPMIIQCSDEFVTDMYCQSIAKAYHGAVATEVDAKDLTINELSSSSSNFIINKMLENNEECPIIIIKNIDCMSQHVQKEFLKFLNVEYLRSFRIDELGINLDISSAVLILVASGNVDEELSSACDVIKVASTASNERATVMKYLLSKEENYDVARAIDKDSENMIIRDNSLSIKDMIKDLSRYCYSQKMANKDTIITTNITQKFVEKNSRQKKVFGFGGSYE